jgi:large subunit ribosomal protein L32
MANPKRKHSRMRTSIRRANWKLEATNYIPCPQCKEPKRSHHVCPSCGFYNNEMIKPVNKEKKKGAAGTPEGEKQ